MPATILLVDDDPDILLSLQNRVSFLGHEALTATTGKDALRLIQEEEPDLVLLDLKLPDLDGMEVLEHVRGSTQNHSREADTLKVQAAYTPPLIIILTAFGTIELAVKAMQQGAFDFIPKPFTADHLTVVINKALEAISWHRQIDMLRQEVDRQFQPSTTTNKHVNAQMAIAKRAASSNVTVLLLGETGTGKEVAARAIHRASPRSSRPFVAVNCAAIPDTLIESELFGHEKGAFTGATSMRRGQFEQADGGTLFLDEIGDMSLTTQAKVLRVLAEQQFTRVGGNKPIKVDVRVLAATHKDLQQAVQQGTFRNDLYFRLAVITVTLPPLRDRMDDLPALVHHFLTTPGKFGLNKRCELSDSALQTLQRYSWPGNIRELENVLTRAMVLCPENTIESEHLSLAIPPNPGDQDSTEDGDAYTLPGLFYESRRAYERKLIEDALRKNGWNQTKTADAMGLQRTYLTKLIRKLGISGRPPGSSSA